MLAIAGVAGASAMILPGVSGGYLLLLLGQYVPILGVGFADEGRGLGAGLDAVMAEMGVVIPVGVGVVLGVVVVANALKWLLARFEKATLGALLGLLFGAVVGLWPFQEGVPPEVGDVVKGRLSPRRRSGGRAGGLARRVLHADARAGGGVGRAHPRGLRRDGRRSRGSAAGRRREGVKGEG